VLAEIRSHEDIDKRGLRAEIGTFSFFLPRPELVHASCLVMRFVTDVKSKPPVSNQMHCITLKLSAIFWDLLFWFTWDLQAGAKNQVVEGRYTVALGSNVGLS